MSERPNVSAEAPESAKATARPLAAEGQDEQVKDELTAASEAAAEHVSSDAEAGGRKDVAELAGELEAARAEVADLKDKWLRLNAEFDNFRKRTAKEKLEMLQFAGENTVKNILPVLDDMERAIANNAQVEDVAVMREGFHLVYNKLMHILGSQGVRPMAGEKGQPFDTDRHEAITKAPAPTNDLKGKVLDVVENGYTLHDKVIRYAKVVVGE